MKDQPSLHIAPDSPSMVLYKGSSSKEDSMLQTIMYREDAASRDFSGKALLSQGSFLPISKCFHSTKIILLFINQSIERTNREISTMLNQVSGKYIYTIWCKSRFVEKSSWC